MPLRCGHLLACFLQSIASKFPVTLSVVNALTVLLTLPSKLSSSTSTGIVSNVSVWPFRTFTVTFCEIPLSPSSLATSALMYVLVEASSSKVFTLIARLPFLRITGTVRRAGKPVCVPSAVVVVCDLSACLWPGSRGGTRINDTF